MTAKRTIAAIALVPSGIFSLYAQPAAVQQLQNDQILRQLQTPPSAFISLTNTPELYPGENADVGPQRILRRTPPNKYFDVILDSQAFFTDNANYAQQPDAISSWVFVNTAQVALTPPVIDLADGKAAVAVGVASQWYNYCDNRIHGLDFNAETAFASAKYTLGNWQIGLGANLTRLVNQGDYTETYREFMPNLGIQRIIPLNNCMFFSLGDLVDYHLTEVPTVFGTQRDANDRLDDVVSVTFTWQITRHILVQPYYHFQYTYYQHNVAYSNDRSDCLQSFGVTAAYYFNANVSVRAFFNYNRRQSSDPNTPSYLEMNGGPGLTLDFRF